MKRTPGKSWMLAYCGMASALCIAVMLLGTALPILLFIAPAVAGFLIAAVREECGSRMALTAYAAVSLLSLLLVPDRGGGAGICCAAGVLSAGQASV